MCFLYVYNIQYKCSYTTLPYITVSIYEDELSYKILLYMTLKTKIKWRLQAAEKGV